MSGASMFQPGDIAEIIDSWGGRPDSVRFLGGSHCNVYGFTADDVERILRLTPEDYRSPAAVQAEIDWVRYLAGESTGACAPVAAGDGDLIEVTDRNSARHVAAVFERAMGKPGDIGAPRNWNHSLFEMWGRELGRMHALGRDFEPPGESVRHELNGAALVQMAAGVLPKDQTPVLRALEEQWGRIAELDRRSEGYGMVHGDMTLSNFLVGNGGLSVFDFDDCMRSWFVYDLAVLLFATCLGVWAGDPGALPGFSAAFFTSFMSGYRREHRLAERWIAELPLFLSFFNSLIFVSCFQKKARPMETDTTAIRFAEKNFAAGKVDLGLDFVKACANMATENAP